MSSLQILGAQGTTTGNLDLTAALADQVIKPHLIHEVVTQELAARRSGSANTKTRADVRGGGAKPWKQKGTGKARVGSIRTPLWVGGGNAHPPKLKPWGVRLQKRVRRLGLRVALAAKYRDRRLTVVADLAVPAGRTREAVEVLRAHGCGAPGGRARFLFLSEGDAVPVPLARAVANLPGVRALPAVAANVRAIVAAERVFVTEGALASICSRATRED